MLPLGIIADDLTGAMDTGLQFSKRGLETVVSLTWQALPDAQVVVADTDSRAASASEAHRRLLSVAHQLGARALYKKVDSTMRGNVGYELRALLEVLQPRAIVVAPAFPREGRTTLWGHQQVSGRPLELTPFANDPRWPMRESYLPALLMQQSGREATSVGLDSVRSGVDSLVRALQGRPEPLIVVDAVEQCHLRTIARAIVTLGEGWLPCGSAGLAEEWADALGVTRGEPLPGPPAGSGPVLVVAGSRNQVTISQVKRLCDLRGVPRVDVDARQCYDAERETERLALACLAFLSVGRDVVLSASASALIPGGGELVARVLSGAIARIAPARSLGGMVLTGGDIAVAACRALRVRALRIAQEVQPGIPGGQLVGGICHDIWVVTKAGGFGDDDALLDALRYLHGEQDEPHVVGAEMCAAT